ncbi:MAG: Cof-type HAD-IIB family hydrolase [Eubacterium sp.]|jgi:Cof subfamily protein (haloacid dehalogenase superfamily)|nr:Cof-type HAD-IIB family hydrolase [Eubacterium sp.]
MNIKALALDLDGTLTDSRKKLTCRTRTAIQAAIDGGIKIILASGRPVLGIESLARELLLYDRGGYILAYNGGQIIDCGTNSVIFERLLNIKYYAEICRSARDFGVNALTYDAKGVVAESSMAEYVIKEAFNNGLSIRKVGKLEDEITSEVVKFMIVGEPNKIALALKSLRDKLQGSVNVFLSEPYFMELTAPGIEKASALERLAAHLGINSDEFCGIGDGFNDIPMLKFCGYAVAMANAYKEVKDVADYITKSNDEEGVAAFLEDKVLGGLN